MGLDEFSSPNAQTQYSIAETDMWQLRRNEEDHSRVREWLKENDSMKYVCSKDMTEDLDLKKSFITLYLRDMPDVKAWNPKSKTMTVFQNPYWEE